MANQTQIIENFRGVEQFHKSIIHQNIFVYVLHPSFIKNNYHLKNQNMRVISIIGIFFLGILDLFLIQYSFKSQIVIYPLILTTILFFVNGIFLKNIVKKKFIIYYLITAIPLIVIQVYGLTINFSGLKYLSPSLILISFLSFTLGYKYQVLQTKLKIVLSIAFIITISFWGLYMLPKVQYVSKKQKINKVIDLSCNLIDIYGKQLNLNDLKDKIIFINFWDSKCGYCFEKLPYIEELRNKLKNKNIVFLEINPSNIDNYTDFKTTVKKYHQFQEIPTYFDENSILANKLGVNALPHQFIIDKNKKIRSSYLGFNKNDKSFFVIDNLNYLEELLNEK